MNGLPNTTFEIAFFNLQDQLDSVQQYSDEGTARTVLRLFDEPDSAELYSRIILISHDWSTGAEAELDALTF